jgi:hypothetical protein
LSQGDDFRKTTFLEMKRPSTYLGFAATASVAVYGVIKFLRLEGAVIMMFVAGILLAIYFSWFFLSVIKERSGKQIRPVHIIGVLLFAIFIIATLLRLNHFWQISGWLTIILLVAFTVLFIPWLTVTHTKENKHDLLKNLVAGIGLDLIAVSLYGFLLHWPFHKELFVTGNVFLFLIYLPWYIFPKNKKHVSFDFMFQCLIVSYILLLFLFGIFLKWPVTHLP